MLLTSLAFAAAAVFADPECNNDFLGFQPAEKLKYDEKGDKVQAQSRPNTRAVCFDLESKGGGRKNMKKDPEGLKDDEVGEETSCEICVGTPGHLKCKQGIENLMEYGQKMMDCIEDIDELNIADVWVKMGAECQDALWIDAILVWADKWTCTNPTQDSTSKHTGKTFKPTPPKTESTRVAYGKSNNYGWCLSNDPDDALQWMKGSRGSRYRAQKVIGETCYPVLRFTIDGGDPVVQGYASADLLEAAEMEAIKALWLKQLPTGRRRWEIRESEEYQSIKRQWRRRTAGTFDNEYLSSSHDIVIDTVA